MPVQNLINPLIKPKGERVAVIAGLRTPFVRKDGGFKDAYAADLGSLVVNELLNRSSLERDSIEQLIFGQVIQQPDIPNLAREIALSLSMNNLPAYTLNCSCVSGLQAVANIANGITSGAIKAGIAGGADSISNAQFSLSPRLVHKIKSIFKTSNWEHKFQLLKTLSWQDFKPQGINLKDYLTQLSVAEASEQLAQQFAISRAEQDEYARQSCEKASNAQKIGWLKAGVVHSFPRPYKDFVIGDQLNRAATKSKYYERVNPLLNQPYASVTEANMSAPVDGAAGVILMAESEAKRQDLQPMGYIRSFASQGNDVWQEMFMGAPIAAYHALQKAGVAISDLRFIDIHETSAAQMLANLQAFESKHFAQKYLQQDQAIGAIDSTKLNLLGGSIAYGNPRAATSLRLLIQSLWNLQRHGGGLSLIASNGLGGLSGAMVLETE